MPENNKSRINLPEEMLEKVHGGDGFIGMTPEEQDYYVSLVFAYFNAADEEKKQELLGQINEFVAQMMAKYGWE